MTDTQGNIQAEEKTAPAIPTETKPAEANEPSLPDGVSERTKAEFDKLRERDNQKIAELKAELDAYKSKTSVLDELKVPDVQVETPNLSTMQVAEIKSRFVDDQGYVDVAKFEEALSKAEERAKRAEDIAARIEKKIQNSEETEQVKVAHTEFPQLDPHNEKFDPNFYRLVKLELVDQMMNGKKDMLEAARSISKLYTPKTDVQEVKTEAVKEYKSNVTKREHANEAVSGRGKGEPSDLDELKRRTQAGDSNALFKRLQASGN